MNKKADNRLNKILILSILLLVLDVVVFVLSIVFVSFTNQILVSILSIICVVVFTSISLFLIICIYLPKLKYNKWFKRINSYKKNTLQGKLKSIEKNLTLKDVGTCNKLVIDIDNQTYIKFLPLQQSNVFLKIENEYVFTIVDIYVLDVKEIK